MVLVPGAAKLGLFWGARSQQSDLSAGTGTLQVNPTGSASDHGDFPRIVVYFSPLDPDTIFSSTPVDLSGLTRQIFTYLTDYSLGSPLNLDAFYQANGVGTYLFTYWDASSTNYEFLSFNLLDISSQDPLDSAAKILPIYNFQAYDSTSPPGGSTGNANNIHVITISDPEADIAIDFQPPPGDSYS